MRKYRIVTSHVEDNFGLFKKQKTILVVQKLGRGITHNGIVEDVWYDCNQNDITDVVLDLFSKEEK